MSNVCKNVTATTERRCSDLRPIAGSAQPLTNDSLLHNCSHILPDIQLSIFLSPTISNEILKNDPALGIDKYL